MKRFLRLFAVSCCGTALVVSFSVSHSPLLSFQDVDRLFAGVFFTESVTPEQLQEIYTRATHGERKLRVLIVPGHDNDAWGTEFQGVREADMNVVVGEELARLLSADSAYEPILTRTTKGYAPEFQNYFETERDMIATFVAEKKQTMRELVRAGSVHLTDGVIHNSAPNEVATKLYSFNKWANEHRVDIVLHIHFNDYPGRRSHKTGRYSGFALYVPDSQFSNARASKEVALSLLKQFLKFYAESNLPIEDSGIVEDQGLIAIGSYNTLDPASVLIEYGYIYEQKFIGPEVRARVLKELAFQTYQGLNRFFGKNGEIFQKYPTTLLPHNWSEPLVAGGGGNPSVLSLQTALLLEEMYPPEGKSKRDCPLTGSFGPCTILAVKDFQEKHGLPPSGTVGELTLQKLNEKYSH